MFKKLKTGWRWDQLQVSAFPILYQKISCIECTQKSHLIPENLGKSKPIFVINTKANTSQGLQKPKEA